MCLGIKLAPSYSMILHVSDFHCNERWFRWLLGSSHRYSLVCITGDLLDLNPYLPLDRQVDRVIPFLREMDTPLAVVSGNHDSAPGAGSRLEHAQWLGEVRGDHTWIDGDTFEHDGFLFRCLPWSGTLPIAGANEVWLHHAPPSQAMTAISRVGCDFGDFNLGEQVRAGQGPNLVLCGHVHEPARSSTCVGGSWSLNPGFVAKATVPSYFEIDLIEGIAEHHYALGKSKVVRLW